MTAPSPPATPPAQSMAGMEIPEDVGGLVGSMDEDSTLTASYATGTVNGSGNVGGLVGSMSEGTLTASYATGTVNGNGNVGGLVGLMGGGTLTASYATGTVNGGDGMVMIVGGLVGLMHNGSTLTRQLRHRHSQWRGWR